MYVIVEDKEYLRQYAVEIEAQIVKLNQRGLSLLELPIVALDRQSRKPFIVNADMAVMQKDADNSDLIVQWFKSIGLGSLVILRENARNVLPEGYNFVYASFSRPVSKLWAHNLSDCLLIHNDKALSKEAIPYTWVIAKQELSENTRHEYELKLCYGRII